MGFGRKNGMVLGFSALLMGLLAMSGCATATSGRFSANTAAKIQPTKTIVLIHGMYLTPDSWQEWKTYFEKQGYTVMAPAWPQHERSVAELRVDSAALNRLTLAEVVDHYRQIIKALPEKPILIGHSMGGLVTQLLLQEGLAAAGVAIDSAPPKGLISLKYSFLKSNWGVINPFAPKTPLRLSPEQFAYGFVNTLPKAEQQRIYERYTVPESRTVGKGPSTPTAAIDFSKPRVPLLLIAGAEDHTIPASLNYRNFKKYAKSPSTTEFVLFPGRSHFIIGQPGWQEVAKTVLDWLHCG